MDINLIDVKSIKEIPMDIIEYQFPNGKFIAVYQGLVLMRLESHNIFNIEDSKYVIESVKAMTNTLEAECLLPIVLNIYMEMRNLIETHMMN